MTRHNITLMDLENEINKILGDDSLDDVRREQDKCDLIEDLIPRYDWKSVQGVLITVLEENNRSQKDYITAAEVFWGAVLDGRDVSANRVIALLYHRLEPDPGSNENNLAWSITSKLKGVDYLSEYDPLEDPDVKVEIKNIKNT